MEFLLDMVHDNPGEPPAKTVFRSPAVLTSYGYNGQVFKHWNCAADFAAYAPGVIPQGSPDGQWIAALQNRLRRQIDAAGAAGLAVYFHIDLFVLPKLLVEHFGREICDAEDRISLEAPRTLEVHRALFDELFARFPETAGLIVRVGETYLYDTPYHVGNGPIRAAQYDATACNDAAEQRRYRILLEFLREEICVRHDKLLFFRTWDCYPDKLHANLAYYQAVTDAIQPHKNLIFSIKHTALDFCRYVDPNPCLGQGHHRQIVEVQCQREYEGKGAYPNYVMDGVIDGFPELPKNRRYGLRVLWSNPLICGIFTWSRGGGWYGPYLQNEIWCRLNAWVIARWAADPYRQERALFAQFFQNEYGALREEIPLLREITDLASRGLLAGRYCGTYDRTLDGKRMPTNLWMRDDRLGGLAQVEPIFAVLRQNGTMAEALAEKREAAMLWREAARRAENLATPALRQSVLPGCQYAAALFALVAAGWAIFTRYYAGTLHASDAPADFASYDAAHTAYAALAAEPKMPSLYKEEYLNLPGTPPVPGMAQSIAECRQAAGLVGELNHL